MISKLDANNRFVFSIKKFKYLKYPSNITFTEIPMYK